MEGCKGWCSEKHAASHCPRCDCKACSWCLDPAALARTAPGLVSSGLLTMRPTSSGAAPSGAACTPATKTDTDHEGCATWCQPQHQGAHCPLCACKGCSWCHVGGGGPVSSRPRVACAPHDSNDVNFATCEPFCNSKHIDSHCPLCHCRACTFCSGMDALTAPPPPPDPQCATVAKRGSWSGGVIAQVRLKVWEARSLVRLEWPDDAKQRVVGVEGARLVLTSGGSFTFALDDAARAISVGTNLKAFEIQLAGSQQHLEAPASVSCHYQLRSCSEPRGAGARWQLVEDWGTGYRAEILISKWAAGGQVPTA